MLAASHFIAGAAIGAACPRARIAVPVAFVSHFVLDQVPHSCFNALPPSAKAGLGSVLVNIGMAIDGAVIVCAIVLALRMRTRWVVLAAAVAAFSPDVLCYMPPISTWFLRVPGASIVPWVHRTFHCDVTRSHLALGFITQVVVVALSAAILARKAQIRPCTKNNE